MALAVVAFPASGMVRGLPQVHSRCSRAFALKLWAESACYTLYMHSGHAFRPEPISLLQGVVELQCIDCGFYSQAAEWL